MRLDRGRPPSRALTPIRTARSPPPGARLPAQCCYADHVWGRQHGLPLHETADQLPRPSFGTRQAGRAGTPDEIAAVGALLLGPEGAFITGSDFLADGGVTASYFYGPLAPDPTA